MNFRLKNRLAISVHIAKSHNVLITGSSGGGNSFLRSALDHQAHRMELKGESPRKRIPKN